MKPPSPRAMLSLAAAFAICFLGCFTEVGNPGKPPIQNDPQEVTANFRIDYSEADSVPAKVAAISLGEGRNMRDDLLITQFYFNVVEANYRTVDDVEGRIWKVADSLGSKVDFTGKDTTAVLPPVKVPPGEWSILKLESRIPLHDSIRMDTIDFDTYGHRGYIKGYLPVSQGGRPFLCQLPPVDKINLVYDSLILQQARVGESYHIDVVFFGSRWIASAPAESALVYKDKKGRDIVLIDLEHNRGLYDLLRAAFFKSFNSLKVWKEGVFVP